ncbi:MAG: NAD(+) diphosphatase [Proteobacteria bacterium]|nr:NAD(+) diphosphatase [Pseudomonadota bacterium]
MSFIHDLKIAPDEDREGMWFLFYGDHILVRTLEESARIPWLAGAEDLRVLPAHSFFLGTIDGKPCFTAGVEGPLELPGTSFRSLRSLLGEVEEEMFAIAGRAFQILEWERTNRFCGRCGKPTEPMPDKGAMLCPACKIQYYPRIVPAVIVAVVNNGRILLAHARRHPGAFYSVLAGFVEPGETFEECVCREIREEAGIEVENIRYFKSQPWPFPNTLMVGFTADYTKGDLVIEERELVHAAWFEPEEVLRLEIPRNGTIARELIDWFLAGRGSSGRHNRP